MLGDREEGDEELFETASSVSSADADSDDEGDRFPSAGAAGGEGPCDQQDRRRRAPVPQPQPQPLRRMNSDSIYDMASMVSQLPAKKGLSRHYEGKAQSFACMSEVRCLDDLRKKDSPYKQKVKSSCKGYVALGGMMMANKPPSSGSCAGLGLAAANGFRTSPIQDGYQYHQ
ncbi:uncharacterized protein LOC100383996 [Zea mays]|uniref:Oxidative stress 3 n=1 Tax=Zea mays TaxID=4577 RepID=C0PKM7_MAIZE|nr:uncharacterized protein LOC100383996 [Zea mays]ACN35743.1 unknown [Zea mays]AQK87802.1 oxidative stress 3 [Zea mays]|eukprot:NP_001170079.1 uncharacterized protein LOC100383996 [Zea mays]